MEYTYGIEPINSCSVTLQKGKQFRMIWLISIGKPFAFDNSKLWIDDDDNLSVKMELIML